MKTLRSDLVFIWLLATTALCFGLIIDSFSPEGLRKLAGGWHPERSTDQPLSCIYNDSTASHLRRNRRRFALVENMPRHEFRYLPEVPWDWWTEDSVNFGIVVVGFG